MADRPIIFSAPMVRALLEGRKTQTRRVLSHKSIDLGIAPRVEVCHPEWIQFLHPQGGPLTCVKWPYATGDRLYVREAWRPHYLGDGVWNLDVSYPADGERRMISDGEFGDKDWNWPKAADRGNVTPLHMPRWASRLTLTVTDVRVQRLQDISEADAIAEGIDRLPNSGGPNHFSVSVDGGWANDPKATGAYAALWNSLHGPGAWGANPWVVALTVTVQRGNIDQIGGENG
jgi:hypothetical protein